MASSPDLQHAAARRSFDFSADDWRAPWEISTATTCRRFALSWWGSATNAAGAGGCETGLAAAHQARVVAGRQVAAGLRGGASPLCSRVKPAWLRAPGFPSGRAGRPRFCAGRQDQGSAGQVARAAIVLLLSRVALAPARRTRCWWSGPSTVMNEVLEERIALHHLETITVALVGQPNVGKSAVFSMTACSTWPTGRQDERAAVGTNLPPEWRPRRRVVICRAPQPDLLLRRGTPHAITSGTVPFRSDDRRCPPLERNLYLLTGCSRCRVVLGLNMLDVVSSRASRWMRTLEAALGLPVVPMIASKGEAWTS